MRITRAATTWAKVRTRTAGGRAEATTYLADIARRDADPLAAALHDPVTGLPERALLLDRMELALARARRRREGVALLLLVVEDLATLRARLGTQADRVLREVAERVLGAVRDTDTVARFGAAELAVLCEGVSDRETLLPVADRIADRIRAPYAVRLGTVDLTMDLEVVLVPADTPPLALLDLAERTLVSRR